MANRNATFAKRQRELAQKDKVRQREQRKAQRRANATQVVTQDGEDPDIAGIVPGPQPRPEED